MTEVGFFWKHVTDQSYVAHSCLIDALPWQLFDGSAADGGEHVDPTLPHRHSSRSFSNRARLQTEGMEDKQKI